MKKLNQTTKNDNRIGKLFLSSSSVRMSFLSSFVLTLFPIVLCIVLKGLTVHALDIADDEVVSSTTRFGSSRVNVIPTIPNFLRVSSHLEMMNKALLNNRERRLMMDNNEDYEEHDSGTHHIALNPYEIKDMERLVSLIQKRRLLNDFCVTDESEFRTAVTKAPDSDSTSTRIDICVPVLNIDASTPNPIYQGINIQNKNLDIRCNVSTTMMGNGCIINAQGLSRHFYSDFATITFRDIIFQNGNGRKDVSQRDGGALLLDQSFIVLERCQFKNNIGNDGGAIASLSSDITFIGGNVLNPTLFENNTSTDSGGAIYAFRSIINAINGYFVFRNNSAGNTGDGGAIYVEVGRSFWSNGIFDRNSIVSASSPGDSFNKGGAFYLSGGKASFTNITFQNNFGDVGGALVALNVDTYFSNVNFSSNNAKQYGGAVYCEDCLAEYNMTYFLDNSVSTEITDTGGGAVNAFNGKVSFTNVVFRNNNAIRGAAIEASNVTFLADKMTVVSNNSTNYGAFLFGESNITIKNSEFNANFVTDTTNDMGSIIIWESTLASSKNDFYKAQVEQCDTLIYNFDNDNGNYRSSCFNFRPNVPIPRRRKLEVGRAIENELSRSLGKCVQSDRELRDAVRKCFPRVPCRIDVCKSPIRITRPASRILENAPESGIDLSYKDIIMDCVLPCPTDRCMLDGDGDSRLFYGSNSNVTFRNFVFANGYDTIYGGALKMENQSVLSLVDCSFLNNSAYSGGALFVNDTELLIEGEMTSFFNNTGNGAVITIHSSLCNLSNAVIEGNNNSEFGGGIDSFDSKIVFGSLSLVQQTPSQRRRNIGKIGNNSCDIYIATNPNDLRLNPSCVSLEKTTNKSLVIDPVTTCPLTPTPTVAAPVTAPPPAPSPPTPTPPTPSPPTPTPPTPTHPTPTHPTPAPPTQPSCFSGWNIVEVKDVGNIQMDQLRIGDFVKTVNGQFTQIYGFGHLDQSLEEVFLQIQFNQHDSSQTDIIPTLPLEVSARHLLMLDKVGFQYPIRASDVVIGDVLNGLHVKKIQNVIRRGVYAPLTQSGDFVVSGIHASNYVDVLNKNWGWNQHVLGHFIFFPQRTFCSYFIETCKKEGYINGYGYLSYLVVQVGSVVNQVGPFVSVSLPSFLMICFVVSGIVCWLLFRFGNRSYQLRKM